jgi:hypothetical protein
MTTSNNQQAVAVKTRVNAGRPTISNHNETVVVKTRITAGAPRDPQSGLPTGVTNGIIAVL